MFSESVQLLIKINPSKLAIAPPWLALLNVSTQLRIETVPLSLRMAPPS